MADSEILKPRDAIKTYRYLRVGMVGAVVALAASIIYEHSKVSCWQTSISAYYYTPVRAIFVGSMMAVGLSLIVYKGRGVFEDGFLNFAGMLAPVVAIAPTTDVGTCWSIEPIPRPVSADGSLAGWVVANIDNNFIALLTAGFIGLVVAALLAIITKWRTGAPLDRGTSISLFITFVVLVVAVVLFNSWADFDTRAHGIAAVLMFVFLILAIFAKVYEERRDHDKPWFLAYGTVGLLMVLGGLLLWLTRVFGEHTVFALETYEIILFATYWILQTVQNWTEKVAPSPASLGTARPTGADAVS